MPRCDTRNPNRNAKGQSTLEYLLVGVAVLLAVIFGINTFFAKEVKARMDDGGAVIDKAGEEFETATGAPPKVQ